jgi:hypothetical protein
MTIARSLAVSIPPIKLSSRSDSSVAEQGCPGELEWTVEVPECDKEYTISMQQEECESLESPKFTVACAGEDWEDNSATTTSSAEWEDASVTVVYVDEECSCTKTKATAAPTPGKNEWYDADISCTVSVQTPASGWGDASVPAAKQTWADADSSSSWADVAASTGAKWADASASPASSWADVAPTASSAGWADNSASTPAAGSTWADSPVAPLESKPPVAEYKGAAAKLTGSASALIAVFLAALAL